MDLKEIRKSIDEVDKELYRLFEKRMELAKCVAESKIETCDCIYKPDREEEVIRNFSKNAADDMKIYYEAFIRRIMLISREYQYSIINADRGNHIPEDRLTIQFTYGGKWPDHIITAINDAGADIINFTKDNDYYTIEIDKKISDEKLGAILLMVQNEAKLL